MGRLLQALGLLLLVLVTSCTMNPWREHAPPWTAGVMTGAEDARATMSDGRVLVLADPTIEVAGDSMALVGRVGEQRREVPLDEITRLESRRTEFLPLMGNVVASVGTFMVFLGVAATVALIAVLG